VRFAVLGGLSDRITFALEDYRATQGTFDRIYANKPFGGPAQVLA
jgi:cyclopropane fatty-acyl-phospholipid synthase-like methyltransferase